MAFFIPFLRLFRLSKAKLSKNAPEFTELECLDLPRLLVFCREIGSTILTDNVGFEYKFVEKTEQECLLGHFFIIILGESLVYVFKDAMHGMRSLIQAKTYQRKTDKSSLN